MLGAGKGVRGLGITVSSLYLVGVQLPDPDIWVPRSPPAPAATSSAAAAATAATYIEGPDGAAAAAYIPAQGCKRHIHRHHASRSLPCTVQCAISKFLHAMQVRLEMA